jgi:hypothetical protein
MLTALPNFIGQRRKHRPVTAKQLLVADPRVNGELRY